MNCHHYNKPSDQVNRVYTEETEAVLTLIYFFFLNHQNWFILVFRKLIAKLISRRSSFELAMVNSMFVSAGDSR